MSGNGASKSNCSDLEWAHWKGLELQLEPAEQLTLNAIAGLVNNERYARLTGDDLFRHSRLKERTTSNATRELVRIGLIDMRRTRTGFHYWLLRDTPNGKTHHRQELDANIPMQEPQKIPISPDPQNLPISPRSVKNTDLNAARLVKNTDLNAARSVKNTDQDPQNLPISYKTPVQTLESPVRQVTPVSPDSGNNTQPSHTHPSQASARVRVRWENPFRWDEFLAAYPANDGSPSKAKLAYAQVLAEGVDPQVLIDAVKVFPFRQPQRFVLHPVHWLEERRWEAKVDTRSLEERAWAKLEAQLDAQGVA
jgi:hypothetical protein